MRKVILLFYFFLFIGCSSCLNNFYGTNSHPYLNIVPDNIKLANSYIKFYIDSVLNKNKILPDSIKSQFYISNDQKELSLTDRIVHFKNNPEEWYLIAFDATPCWIASIYSPSISNIAIYNKEQLNQDQLERIKNRFQHEILDSAELYINQNHISLP
jgi:hypothetical protein